VQSEPWHFGVDFGQKSITHSALAGLCGAVFEKGESILHSCKCCGIMVFSSTIFLFVFLPVVLVIYYNPIFKGRTFRNIFLLIASLAFYAWGEPVFVFLMLLSIIITWLLGLKIAAGGG
jgi:hypothetical protein